MICKIISKNKEKQEPNLTCEFLSKILKTNIDPDRLLIISSTVSKSIKLGRYTLRIRLEKQSQRHRITIIKDKVFLLNGYCSELDCFIKNRISKNDYENELQNESFYERCKRAAEEGRQRIRNEITFQTNPNKKSSPK